MMRRRSIFALLATLALPGHAVAQSTNNPLSQSPANPFFVDGNTAKFTYAGAATGVALTTPGDVYCVVGSATKIVRVKGIRVSATATAGAVIDGQLFLRSTLDTGGTPASVPIVAQDSNFPAATATATSYSGGTAPTPGTSIGLIRSQKIPVGTQGNSANAGVALYQFSVYWDAAVTLRGTAQSLCVNMTGLAAGASIDVDHEHTEDTQ